MNRRVEIARPVGVPLSVEVTSAGGRRPVVLLSGLPSELAARLARAGFAVVAADCPEPEDIGVALDALKRGALNLEGGERVALLAADEAHGRPAAARDVPWLVVLGATDERNVDTIVQWLARHLV
ncbi:MAG: hypothetical protein DMD33_11670 [Gemmatimonadetes bacterium]|nr:MAG: hypothetical protein DMD33_11670 [Gemmatimonadota bacterium]